MKVYKLYGSSSSTSNALAQIDIQRNGTIVAIQHAHYAKATADHTTVFEVSFASAAQPTTNDTVGPIYEVRSNTDTVLGPDTVFDNGCLTGTAIPVGVGDRLYLHLTIAGTATANQIAVYIHVMEK